MNTLKPFNLEAALAGKKVVTREGEEVSEVYFFKTANETYPIFAVIDGRIENYTITGHYVDEKNEKSKDLFMAAEEVSGFVNIYSTEQGYMVGGNIHAVKSIAIEASGLPNATYITTVPISFTI